MMRRLHRASGFTLVELLIVITLISIIALIVIPPVFGATRRAKETLLRGNLHRLRAAIAQFHVTTGAYPAQLTDLVAESASDLDSSVPETARASYEGPVLTPSGGIPVPGKPGLPLNPFADPTSADPNDHWHYDATNGTVMVADALADLHTHDDDIRYGDL